MNNTQEIDFDRVDAETKAMEEEEALQELNMAEHVELCSGCALCEPDL